MSTTWDPGQYTKFEDQRSRPALELLRRVSTSAPETVVDLGCGTGDVTRAMAERWPAADVLGLDHSEEMLANARTVPSRVRFEQAEIGDWRPARPYDVIFSNAALHWLPHHEQLFPRLLDALAPGGTLAVQMPLSYALPSHRLMRSTLRDGGPEGASLGSEDLHWRMSVQPVASSSEYYDLVAGTARDVDIWETLYLQVLTGKDAVFEWVRGTGLRPILAALDDVERELFLYSYRTRLREIYPEREDGKTLYRFPRLFIVVTN